MTIFNKKLQKNKQATNIADIIKELRPYFWLPFVVTSLLILIVVAFITDYNIRQSEKVLGEQMADKGIRVIWLFENVIMDRIQFSSETARTDYIEELGTADDFAFVAVTDNEGKFLFHSKKEKVGTYINIQGENSEASFWEKLDLLLPNKDGQGSHWGFVTVNNERLFLVHRIYGESIRQGTIRFLHPEITDFFNAQKINHVFAAIYPITLQKDIAHYRKRAFSFSIWVIGFSFLFLWVLSLINRIINNKHNMSVAEKTIAQMYSEVQRLEKEMTKKEKLAAIGDLAACVAHEIRNPLSSIKGYATYFANSFSKDSVDYKAATTMIQEIERINRVVGELMGVSNPTNIQKKLVPVDGIIDSCVTMLQADAKHLSITFKVLGRGKVIEMDPDRIKQAILNICLNAIEAIRDDQVNNEQKQYHIVISTSENEKDYIISIKDNGPGIEKDVLRRIFDPYFTTKKEGTGLGLINVSKILEAHGGSIEVESEKGQGTLFKLYLPK